jgi:mRNA-degrading endonuclease toxin of MazEF toxin-antitoxin module
MTSAKRCEIWLVNLDPTRGQEIQKTRPIVIISSDLFEPIPLRIAIPIASWQDKFSDRPFMVRIDAKFSGQLSEQYVTTFATQLDRIFCFSLYNTKFQKSLVPEFLDKIRFFLFYKNRLTFQMQNLEITILKI